MDHSPPVSSVHEILQARVLEWVAMPFSMESSQTRYWTFIPHIAGRFFTIWATWEAAEHERKARSVGRTRNQLLRLQHLAWWLTSCLVAFELEHWLFSALKLNWCIGSSWVLSALSLWTVTTSSSLLGVLLANSPCRSRDLPASLVAQLVKNLPAVQETWVWSLG